MPEPIPNIQPAGLPVRAALHPADGLYLGLRQIPPAELQDAFLNETVARFPGDDTIVHVPAADIGNVPASTAPAGLIFSTGRSGSTLLSQILKQHHGIVVYAEPQAVNEIIVPPHKWPRRELAKAIRSLGAAFAAHAQSPYVLKFSSWNTLFCDIIAEAFPNSPWAFSLRDPLEVGVSILGDLPGWYRSDQEHARQLARVVDPAGASRSAEDYVARTYGALCGAVGRLDAGRGVLIDYADLPSAAWNTVAPHFGLTAGDGERARMADAAKTYSKAKLGAGAEFSPDIAMKQAAASPALRKAIDAFARPELARLKTRYPA